MAGGQARARRQCVCRGGEVAGMRAEGARVRPGCLPGELELSASAPPEFLATMPGGGTEGGRHSSLFGFPSSAYQRLSYPVSGLIFHAGKWKGTTMKIYVCSVRGWFPTAGRRDCCFPFPFFIRALGNAVGRWGWGASPLRRGLITGLHVSQRAARL